MRAPGQQTLLGRILWHQNAPGMGHVLPCVPDEIEERLYMKQSDHPTDKFRTHHLNAAFPEDILPRILSSSSVLHCLHLHVRAFYFSQLIRFILALFASRAKNQPLLFIVVRRNEVIIRHLWFSVAVHI